LPDEALVNSEITVDAPPDRAYRRMLQPKVMERYLFSDSVEAQPGARGEDLGSEFHCHHGGSLVNMRVVSADPGRELTIIADQPTVLHIMTRFVDSGGGGTGARQAVPGAEPAVPA